MKSQSLLFVASACVLATFATSRAQEGTAEEAAPAAASALSVETTAICLDVQDRTPVEDGTSFPSDVGTLSCFTKIVGAETATTVYHRWYVGDTMAAEIPITVNGPSWRCWTRKTILPSWSGACRVDVATDAGDVIASKPFTLGTAAPE